MVRCTDHLNMTIAVDWDVKPHIKKTSKASNIIIRFSSDYMFESVEG